MKNMLKKSQSILEYFLLLAVFMGIVVAGFNLKRFEGMAFNEVFMHKLEGLRDVMGEQIACKEQGC